MFFIEWGTGCIAGHVHAKYGLRWETSDATFFRFGACVFYRFVVLVGRAGSDGLDATEMMTAAQIRTLICERLVAVNGSCNQTHIDHNDGVFRGLLWVLTGTDPGTELTMDVPHLLNLAGIKHYRREDGTVLFSWKSE